MFGMGKNASRKKALAKLELMSSGEWQCAGCGGLHNGLPDLATNHPHVSGVPTEQELNANLRLDGNFLSEDFCVLNGEHFFIRTILKLPIQGRDDEFGFGVWSSLSRTNFNLYLDSFDEGFPEGDNEHWTSWFSSSLSCFEKSFKAKTWVVPQPNRQRPHVLFVEEEHPIYQFQQNGLEPAELLKIYAHYGCSPL